MGNINSRTYKFSYNDRRYYSYMSSDKKRVVIYEIKKNNRKRTIIKGSHYDLYGEDVHGNGRDLVYTSEGIFFGFGKWLKDEYIIHDSNWNPISP